jgi:2-amino-4-hydroxy-6-hydroxymethyldihydropteridine diphosphokinase/dihydropteroate synthase
MYNIFIDSNSNINSFFPRYGAPNNPIFLMRAFYFVGAARRGVLTAKRVPFRRNINVVASFSFRWVRHHSSSNEPDTPSQWTQHTLAGTSPPMSDTITLTQTDAPRAHRAYIALGSNLGDKVGWIEKACNEMSARGIKVKRTSSLWETVPMYVVDQDVFVNGACEVSGLLLYPTWRACSTLRSFFMPMNLSDWNQVETTLEPLALLDELQSIENALGRVKVIEKGPRNIDLDILLYDDEVIDHERLKVPHPGMFEREFVLRPLAE